LADIRPNADRPAFETRKLGANLHSLFNGTIANGCQRLARTREREALLYGKISYALSLNLQLIPSTVVSFQVELAEGMPTGCMNSTLDEAVANPTL
jgi:hypothetical protein